MIQVALVVNLDFLLKDIATTIGLNSTDFHQCLDAEDSRNELLGDIEEGLRLKLRGTPSFVVDGSVYVGMVETKIYAERGIVLPKQ